MLVLTDAADQAVAVCGQPVDRGLQVVDLERRVAQPQLGGHRGGRPDVTDTGLPTAIFLARLHDRFLPTGLAMSITRNVPVGITRSRIGPSLPTTQLRGEGIPSRRRVARPLPWARGARRINRRAREQPYGTRSGDPA